MELASEAFRALREARQSPRTDLKKFFTFNEKHLRRVEPFKLRHQGRMVQTKTKTSVPLMLQVRFRGLNRS